MAMDPDRPAGRGLEVVFRDLTSARRRLHNLELAALTLGAELIEHGSERATATRAAQILEQRMVERRVVDQHRRGSTEYVPASVDSPELDPYRARGESDSWSGLRGRGVVEPDPGRRRQQERLRAVRFDLLAVLARCRRYRFDNAAFTEEIARGLCAATDKLGAGSDSEVFRVWQRGMLLRLFEEPTPHGRPCAFAVLDAGQGRAPLIIEWDSCERRLALVSRMARAGISPVAICDRLLTDLSIASPLRYSLR
ncbi:hypothetical protein [Nocardia callitridis]